MSEQDMEITGINPIEIMLMLSQYLRQNDLKKLTVQDEKGGVVELTIRASRYDF